MRYELPAQALALLLNLVATVPSSDVTHLLRAPLYLLQIRSSITIRQNYGTQVTSSTSATMSMCIVDVELQVGTSAIEFRRGDSESS